jgi:hypothetical protein
MTGWLPQGMHVPAAARVDSSNFIRALVDCGKRYKGMVKFRVLLFVAPDHLWRLENRTLPAGWPVPAESRLQIMRESAAKAGFRPIPPLLAPPEAYLIVQGFPTAGGQWSPPLPRVTRLRELYSWRYLSCPLRLPSGWPILFKILAFSASDGIWN